MRLLLRIAAVAVAGAALYEAGAVSAAVELHATPAGGLFSALAVAAALALLAMALTGTGRGDATAPAQPSLVPAVRVTFLFVSAAALFGAAWLRGIPYPPVHDPTSYHNDAIAINECAARLLLEGRDPYRELDLFDCYETRRIGPDRTTPLRRGEFADVEIYPTEDQMDRAWAAWIRACSSDRGRAACPPVEFEWRPSYPALSFVLIAPWVALGWDSTVLYVLCLLAAMALVLLRAPASARAFLLTALLAAASVTAFTVGGSADLLYALPLVAAWLWRERRWSALLLGVAAAVKQLAWPFGAFYLLQVAAQRGWREAARRGAIAAGLFAVVNAPFVAWDGGAWIAGLVTPVAEPMFPRGAGLVILSTSGAMPLPPSALYLVLEAAVAVATLVVAWRRRYTSPELGVVLAMVPLYFAWRSLFSYFFLLPLFAAAGIARMPVGELSAETARAAGALTVLAMPAPAAPGRER